MPFTMAVDDDSYILTADLSVWLNILVPLVGWDSPSLGVWVKLLQDSSAFGIFNYPVGLLMVSELGSPWRYLLYYDTWPPVGLQLILDIPLGSKVWYPELVGYPLRSTLAVPPSVYCSNVPPPPSGKFPTSSFQSTFDVTLSLVPDLLSL